MKHRVLKEQLVSLSKEQLESKIDELRHELLTLRLQGATTHVKSFPSTKRALRHGIACGMTLLQLKRSQEKS